MALTDIEKQILDFYSDQNNAQIIEYYRTKTYFEIIKKSRSETVHSAFIAWLLEGKDLPNLGTNSPMNQLFRKLVRYKPEAFDEVLRDAVISNKLVFTSINAETEYPVSKSSKISQYNQKIEDGSKPFQTQDKLDIRLDCKVQIGDTVRAIEVIIENKVCSHENTPAANEKGKRDVFLKNDNPYNGIKCLNYYGYLYQTEKYCAAFYNNEPCETKTIFIYLSTLSSEELDNYKNLSEDKKCKCKEFIQISYQDIVDDIIVPLIKHQNLSAKIEQLLSEYAKTLFIPSKICKGDSDNKNDTSNIDDITIMAVSNLERERMKNFLNEKNIDLLKTISEAKINKSKIDKSKAQKEELISFWDNNEPLFLAALKIFSDDKPEYRSLYEELHTSRKTRKKYIVSYSGETATKRMSKGEAACTFFTKWTEITKPTKEEIEAAFSEFKSSYYSNEKWLTGIIHEATGGNIRINDKTCKVQDLKWDFYPDGPGKYDFRNGKSLHFVKMWRQDDFDKLIEFIEKKHDVFKLKIEPAK